LLRPPRLGGGWSLVRSRLSYLPVIPTYSMLVVERARLYPGVTIPFVPSSDPQTRRPNPSERLSSSQNSSGQQARL
jgi:hypothetical protein